MIFGIYADDIEKKETTTNTPHTLLIKKRHKETKQNEMENNQDLGSVDDYDAFCSLQIQFDLADTKTHTHTQRPTDGYKLQTTAFSN